MSFQDAPYSDMLCDPVLLAGTENATKQTKATEPLTPSSYGTRGSVGTRSSTNSIPSVREPQPRAVRHSSPPQKRRSRHTKSTRSIKEEEEEEDDGTTDKRQKFLEKNRIAASKCREKKKKWVHDLEHNKSELERQNFELRLEHRNLVNELSQTKNMLMNHSACKDPNIDRWLDNEARRIVQTAGANVFSANPLAYAPTNARGRNDSLVSAASMADFDSPSRRASLAYSQAPSSLNDSPIDPFLPMPSLSPKVKEEPIINLDHMSEDMLRS
ncbi:Cyclic AMP-dependent transcription factor ATF-7 [Cytospora mali]|uniref:Cyclic AMP-dependent transcription factor ATF-7 n=1 Tax=Cytospora mali TaxID=578113 RepID=A0A194W467_CYTMA|nr:Cyclic AMP-dependent transcription factor ATF-7 [Valsa mali]